MIDIKKAIAIGKELVLEVYGNLDEIIVDSANSSENIWLIKFRIPLQVKPINSLQNVLGINKRIFYKTVKIDENGNVVGIIDEDLPINQSSEIQPQAV